MNDGPTVDTKEVKKIDKLPADLRKHFEESMEHNKELMKLLAQL